MKDRILNDVSMAAGRHALDVVSGCLFGWEKRDAFEEFVRIVKEAIIKYQLSVEHEESRVRGHNG